MARIRKGKTLFGRDGADVLRGTGQNDRIFGMDGNDRLYGNNGNDFLDGGQGSDSLYGGSGNDTLVVDFDDVIVNGGAGYDRVLLTGIGDGLGYYAGFTQWSWIEEVRGTDFDDSIHIETMQGLKIFGGAGDDQLRGGFGNDRVTGGAGNDWLGDFGGSDTAVFSGAFADYVITLPGDGSVVIADLRDGAPDGTDAVLDFEYFRFSDRTLSLAGLTEIVGNRPTEGNDVLSGTAGDDVIDALGGDDVVNGLGGNDTLTGGDGSDQIFAGFGDDVVHADINDVSVEGGEGYDTLVLTGESGFAGVATASWTGFEVIIGTAHNDVFDAGLPDAGQVGVVIDAGSGDDNVWGTAGDDTFTAGAGSDVFNGADGNDTLVFSGAFSDYDFAPIASDSAWSYDKRGGVPGQGPDGTDAFGFIEVLQFSDRTVLFSDLWTAPRNVVGTDGNDAITASAYDDVIDALAGDDFVIGGEGNDTYLAGAGSDTFVGDTGTDTIRFSGLARDYFIKVSNGVIWAADSRGGLGGGPDGIENIDTTEVFEFADVTFSPIVEVSNGARTLTGTDAADMLIGGMQGDTITGATGDDYIFGGEGADLLEGGAGDDWLVTYGGTAVFAGLRSEYDITFDVDSHMIVTDLVAGRDGQDYVTGTTSVRFADGLFII